jgi:hypothetical protein
MISEPSELFLTTTSPQFLIWNLIEDYYLKARTWLGRAGQPAMTEKKQRLFPRRSGAICSVGLHAFLF